MTNEKFAELVMQVIRKEEYAKLPWIYYDRDGDCIECVLTHENFYAKYVNPYLSLYYSEEKEELMGFLITGVKELIGSQL